MLLVVAINIDPKPKAAPSRPLVKGFHQQWLEAKATWNILSFLLSELDSIIKQLKLKVEQNGWSFKSNHLNIQHDNVNEC
jgi:hypothetical protein